MFLGNMNRTHEKRELRLSFCFLPYQTAIRISGLGTFCSAKLMKKSSRLKMIQQDTVPCHYACPRTSAEGIKKALS